MTTKALVSFSLALLCEVLRKWERGRRGIPWVASLYFFGFFLYFGSEFVFSLGKPISRVLLLKDVLILGVSFLFGLLPLLILWEKRDFISFGMVFFLFGGILLSSSHLGFSLLCLELSGMALFLYLIQPNRAPEREGGLKWFLFLLLGSALCLVGFSFLLPKVGSFSLSHWQSFFAKQSASFSLLFGVTCFLVGLSLMGGVFPLHLALVDAKDGGGNSAFLVVTAFELVCLWWLALLGKIFTPLFVSPFSTSFFPASWFGLLFCLGSASFVFAFFSAFWQVSLRRMMAYLMLAPFGFLLMSLSLFCLLGKVPPFFVSLFSFLWHLLGALVFLASLEKFLGAKSVYDLHNLSGRMPGWTAFFLLWLLSIGGFPLLPGFFALYVLGKEVVQIGGIWWLFPLFFGFLAWLGLLARWLHILFPLRHRESFFIPSLPCYHPLHWLFGFLGLLGVASFLWLSPLYRLLFWIEISVK